jgi:hypothetical protein
MSASESCPQPARRRVHPALFLCGAIVALFVMDRIGSLVLEQITKLSDFRISQIYAGTAKADVLLLGNSVGNAMAVPPQLSKALGRSVFSIAYHGLDARTQQALVEDMIERGEAPKLALMEIRPAAQNWVLAPMFSPYRDFSPRLSALIDGAESDAVPWRKLFHVYGFNGDTLLVILQKVFDRDDQATGPSNGNINEAIKQRWLITAPTPKPVPDQLAAFRETAEALLAAGSRVVVISAPLHPINQTRGPWEQQLVDAVRASMPADVAVIDLSDILTDDHYFEDPTHINSAGRAALEPYLVRIARENGL